MPLSGQGGDSDRFAALEGALRRQIVAGERREEVAKKQHQVALLGQGARFASELARRDSEIGSLQQAVESLQQQNERKDAEIRSLRQQAQRQARQLAARVIPTGGGGADAAGTSVARSLSADLAAARRLRLPPSSWMLTLGVLLAGLCAFLLAIPGGSTAVHAWIFPSGDSLESAQSGNHAAGCGGEGGRKCAAHGAAT
jgi:hypothetical protein